MLRKIWEWLSMSRTERLILYIASKGHAVRFYHRTLRGKQFISINIGSNVIHVDRKEGIYQTLRTLAKFSLEKV